MIPRDFGQLTAAGQNLIDGIMPKQNKSKLSRRQKKVISEDSVNGKGSPKLATNTCPISSKQNALSLERKLDDDDDIPILELKKRIVACNGTEPSPSSLPQLNQGEIKATVSFQSSPISCDFQSTDSDFHSDLERNVSSILTSLTEENSEMSSDDNSTVVSNGHSETVSCNEASSKLTHIEGSPKTDPKIPNANLQDKMSNDSHGSDHACTNGKGTPVVSSGGKRRVFKGSPSPYLITPKLDVLKGVVAYVSVYDGRENDSYVFAEVLEHLGAEIATHMNSRVTHLVFQEGRLRTYENALKRGLKIVSVLWVDECRKQRTRVPEDAFVASLPNKGLSKKRCSPSLGRLNAITKRYDLDEQSPTNKGSSPKSKRNAPGSDAIPTASSSTKKKAKRHFFCNTLGVIQNSPADFSSRKKPEESCENNTPLSLLKKPAVGKKQLKQNVLTDSKLLTVNNVTTPSNAKEKPEFNSSLDDFSLKSMKFKAVNAFNTKANCHVISNDGQKLSMVLTSVDLEDQETIASIVLTLGKFQIKETVDDDTTHLICGQKRRTLNLLFAITQGCWVLSPQWVFASVEAGKWLDEEPYELHDYYPAVQVSRLERVAADKAYKQDILKTIGPFYLSAKCSPPPDKLKRLITSAGGSVTTCYQQASIVVGPLSPPVKKLSQVFLSEKWILDCITEHQCLPMDEYHLFAA